MIAIIVQQRWNVSGFSNEPVKSVISAMKPDKPTTKMGNSGKQGQGQGQGQKQSQGQGQGQGKGKNQGGSDKGKQ